jgi:hypothetical protein
MCTVGRIWIVAQPVESVGVSGEPYTQPYGRPRTYTSAPEMENPRVSDTWKRAVITPRLVAGVGENFTPSMMSRFGRLTWATEMAAPPWVDFAGAMRPVSAVFAVLVPFAFFAVTWTSSVCATSAEVAVYVAFVAPEMAEQPPPVPMHRSHWYEKAGAGLPLHEPGLTVSVLPSCGVPEMVGGAVFFGAEPVAWTTSVGRDVALPDPLALVAVTCTRRRWPTSAVCTVYWLLFAPAIESQLPAWASHRSHWYE